VNFCSQTERALLAIAGWFGKEDRLVRLALNCILAGLVAGFCGSRAAEAQHYPQPFARTTPAAQNAPRQVAYQSAEPIPAGPVEGEVPLDEALSDATDELHPVAAGAFAPPPMPITSSCETYFGRGSACPPQWYLDMGVRVLNRSRSASVLLGSEYIPTSPVPLVPVLDARNVDFDASAGFDVTLGYHLGHDAQNNDDFLEFTYWGANHWNESYSVRGGRLSFGSGASQLTFGDLFTPFAPSNNFFDSDVTGFNRADTMSITYDSELHNFEWNLRFVPRRKSDRLVLHPDGRWEREAPRGWTCNYLLGIRYISYDESFYFHSRGRIDQGGVPIALTTGDYVAFTHNDMAGLQVGAEVLWEEARWNFGVKVKAGPYINWAMQRSAARSTGAPQDPFSGGNDVAFETLAYDDQATFVGELGLMSSYKIRKNFHVHASYDFLWISGMAYAPQQLRFEDNPPDRISVLSTALFQGISLRAELLW
jgi:hypothetical protein